jgi:hypothetical protein
MYKKIILSTLGGAVVLFLAGGLIFGVLLMDMMTGMMETCKVCMNETMSMPWIVVANIIQALLLAIVLDKFGISTVKNGAIAGAWITLLIGVMFDSWMFAQFNFMTPNMMVIDVIANTVMGALAGAVIGLILGKVN